MRYFTSDTHFSHRLLTNIRGFDSIEEHDEALIETWNKHIKPRDEVWHLGDFTLKSLSHVQHVIARLNGTINLVLGNHDHAHPLNQKWTTAWKEANEVFNFVGTQATFRLDKELVFMNHFPRTGDNKGRERYTEWRLRDTDHFLLHGHIHGPEKVIAEGHFHVGWDAWNRPVAEGEVVKAFKEWRDIHPRS